MEAKYKILQNLLREVTKRYDYLFETKEELVRKLSYQATHDFQTGLYNYRALFELGEEKIKGVENGEVERLWIVFIDLDNFKLVNDTFGHKKGDEVLKSFASFLKSFFREEDIVGRLGGDEFVVIVPDVSYEVLKERLVRFKEELRERFKEYGISASIGVSCAPCDGYNFEQLITVADNRMYEAKRLGKDRIQFGEVR